MGDIEIKTVGVVGAGQMGCGIAQVAAVAGYDVLVFDLDGDALAAAEASLKSILSRLVEKGKLSASEAEAALNRIQFVGELASLASCDLVIEAIVEKAEIKAALFKELTAQLKDDAIVATNTSSLSVNALAQSSGRPDRFLGLHFFNPVPLMKLAEVIPAATTLSEVVYAGETFVHRIGHRAVRVADTPGFLVNHLGRAYVTEAFRLLEEGVADPVTIDLVMREGLGFRMGPFELMDLTGLDVTHPVTKAIHQGFYGDPRLRPSYIAEGRVAAGLLGKKSGAGFQTRDVSAERAERWAGKVALANPYGPDAAMVLHRLKASQVSVTGSLNDADLVVLIGDAEDCTTAASKARQDPRKSVLLSRSSLDRPVWELSCGFLTSSSKVRSLAQALGTEAQKVAVLGESPGFIGDRLLAVVVNLAADIAEKRIASPADIDTAINTALGYPFGPLAWGDREGPHRVLQTLECLQDRTGDPRYRASLWLRRRAELGVSLLTEAA